MSYSSRNGSYLIPEITIKSMWVGMAIGIACLSQEYLLPERPVENLSIGTITALISSRNHYSSLPINIIGTLIGSGLEALVEGTQKAIRKIIGKIPMLRE